MLTERGTNDRRRTSRGLQAGKAHVLGDEMQHERHGGSCRHARGRAEGSCRVPQRSLVGAGAGSVACDEPVRAPPHSRATEGRPPHGEWLDVHGHQGRHGQGGPSRRPGLEGGGGVTEGPSGPFNLLTI